MTQVIFIDEACETLKAFLEYALDKTDFSYQLFKDKPEQALDFARKQKIQAAFMGFPLEKAETFSLAEKLLSLCPTMKIILLDKENKLTDALVPSFLKTSLLGVIKKPYSQDILALYIALLTKEKKTEKNYYLQTFGSFELLIDGKAYYFRSTKAKELLALLVDSKGDYLNMEYIIYQLWKEKDFFLAKRLYRDAVYRLRKTLKELDIEELVEFKRGCCKVKTDLLPCDYWSFLKGEMTFTGHYMSQYSWALSREFELERQANKKTSRRKKTDFFE